MSFLDGVSWIGGLLIGLLLIVVIISIIIMIIQIWISNRKTPYKSIKDLEDEQYYRGW